LGPGDRQPRQRLVQEQNLVVVRRRGGVGVEQVQAAQPAAVADPPLPAGVLDQDAAHGLGGSGEEVPTPAPMLGLLAADQPQVGLVDEGGGLERLAGLLVREPLGRQLSQFSVHDGQELFGGAGIAALDRGEDLGDLEHGTQGKVATASSQCSIRSPPPSDKGRTRQKQGAALAASGHSVCIQAGLRLSRHACDSARRREYRNNRGWRFLRASVGSPAGFRTGAGYG
jgi:hypothetical protein